MTEKARQLPRWARWTIAPLLVAVPTGYLVISAEQSRGTGVVSQLKASTAGLTHLWPTRLQSRVYQVNVPRGSVQPGYLETNYWSSSSFYVQFVTNPSGLDKFLASIHSNRSALRTGNIPVTAAQAKRVGWSWGPGSVWAGLQVKQPGDKPDHSVVVNLSNPNRPQVYVVSTVNF
jgi:hypothetical protein